MNFSTPFPPIPKEDYPIPSYSKENVRFVRLFNGSIIDSDTIFMRMQISGETPPIKMASAEVFFNNEGILNEYINAYKIDVGEFRAIDVIKFLGGDANFIIYTLNLKLIKENYLNNDGVDIHTFKVVSLVSYNVNESKSRVKNMIFIMVKK